MKYWYGIYPIQFIWHNEWSDPELKAYGKTVNVHDIEDGLYERFYEESQEKGIRFAEMNDESRAFEDWMLSNKDYVRQEFKDLFVNRVYC